MEATVVGTAALVPATPDRAAVVVGTDAWTIEEVIAEEVMTDTGMVVVGASLTMVEAEVLQPRVNVVRA